MENLTPSHFESTKAEKFIDFLTRFCRVALCVLLFGACGPEKKTDDTVIPETPVVTKPRVIPPDFNEDSAFAYVKAQADIGPRLPGTPEHAKSVDYYKKQLEKFGAQVVIQTGNATTFDQKSWLLKNVIASFNPTATNRILLAAHYDSRPFCEKETDAKLKDKPCPGVNDGASGVGVLIEVARVLQQKDPGIGVDIILFDLEDYGIPNGGPEAADTWCLGSQHWSKNPHKQGYSARFGIVLDMVGARDAIFAR
ncbi:MAG: glutamine cyclotransferase, partial [Bacteroidetes bacterium]|nr:glutamine cyclotransferase [Bacteroidota bacterium]